MNKHLWADIRVVKPHPLSVRMSLKELVPVMGPSSDSLPLHPLGHRKGILSAHLHWNPVKGSSVRSLLGLSWYCESDSPGYERATPIFTSASSDSILLPLPLSPIIALSQWLVTPTITFLPCLPFQSLQCAFCLRRAYMVRWVILSEIHSALPACCCTESQAGYFRVPSGYRWQISDWTL